MHPEQPSRLVAIERALAARDWLGFERVRSPAVDRSVLTAVHPERYVASIERACAAGGGLLDADTDHFSDQKPAFKLHGSLRPAVGDYRGWTSRSSKRPVSTPNGQALRCRCRPRDRSRSAARPARPTLLPPKARALHEVRTPIVTPAPPASYPCTPTSAARARRYQDLRKRSRRCCCMTTREPPSDRFPRLTLSRWTTAAVSRERRFHSNQKRRSSASPVGCDQPRFHGSMNTSSTCGSPVTASSCSET